QRCRRPRCDAIVELEALVRPGSRRTTGAQTRLPRLRGCRSCSPRRGREQPNTMPSLGRRTTRSLCSSQREAVVSLERGRKTIQAAAFVAALAGGCSAVSSSVTGADGPAAPADGPPAGRDAPAASVDAPAARLDAPAANP